MAWTRDTGYGPAYDHSGYPAIVLPDGTDTSEVTPTVDRTAVGWRAACECGWRGRTLFRRDQAPGRPAHAPDRVDGFDTGTGAYAEWEAHLYDTLPELVINDLVWQPDHGEGRLRATVRMARLAGMSWSTIANAAGVSQTEAYTRWGGADRHPAAQHQQGRGRRPAPGAVAMMHRSAIFIWLYR